MLWGRSFFWTGLWLGLRLHAKEVCDAIKVSINLVFALFEGELNLLKNIVVKFKRVDLSDNFLDKLSLEKLRVDQLGNFRILG